MTREQYVTTLGALNDRLNNAIRCKCYRVAAARERDIERLKREWEGQ